jgi:hypothetical protein
MVCTDLNAILANLTAIPEGSDFTSIQERICALPKEIVMNDGCPGVFLPAVCTPFILAKLFMHFYNRSLFARLTAAQDLYDSCPNIDDISAGPLDVNSQLSVA